MLCDHNSIESFASNNQVECINNYNRILIDKILNKTAVIGLVGLGYVGLPLALEFAYNQYRTIGFDTDEKKIPILLNGDSYIKHISADRIKAVVNNKMFTATSDMVFLSECDCIIVCVPTPLDINRDPDLSFIENSGKVIAKYLHAGQLITLESSTYPGTTEEILLPLFENVEIEIPSNNGNKKYRKLKVGEDFFLAFSPEREDPNNPSYSTSTIPKVVGGITPSCLEVSRTLYDQIIIKTVPVSSTRTAEATKLLENIYRSINIALVNELKMVFDRMNIDIWEVIDAAKTKPFGFHAFDPGPGLGGHCIPIDPFYLTWKAREYDVNTKFIELAGEINTYQPYYVVNKVIDSLNNSAIPIINSRILILGASYKKNVDDMRESPTLKLIEILQKRNANVDYYDPYVPKLHHTRRYKIDLESINDSSIGPDLLSYDLVLLSTDHDCFNYKTIAQYSKLIVDTRNAFERHGIKQGNIYKA